MIPSILQIRVGASLELVEEPVDLVDLPTEAPQLRVVGVALLYQLVGVLVQGAADGVALVSAYRDGLRPVSALHKIDGDKYYVLAHAHLFLLPERRYSARIDT